MGYISNSMIGKKVKLNKKLESMSGYFEKGTVVEIYEIDCGSPCRGYSIKDEFGNKMIECGFNFFDKEANHD